MRIGTLNLGHQTLKPKTVPSDLLDALFSLELDLLFLTEFVETSEYRNALEELFTPPWATNAERLPSQ